MEEKVGNFEASIDVLEERLNKIKENRWMYLAGYVIAGIFYAGIVAIGSASSAIPVTFSALSILILVMFGMAIFGFAFITTNYDKAILGFIIFIKKQLETK